MFGVSTYFVRKVNGGGSTDSDYITVVSEPDFGDSMLFAIFNAKLYRLTK